MELTWKKNIERMPMAAYMQKERRAGICVVDPIPKAMKLVREVMVMATPACSIVLPSLSATPPDLGVIQCNVLSVRNILQGLNVVLINY